jgi:ABC-type uncharacterized transport system fused permease/ATPase subunit
MPLVVDTEKREEEVTLKQTFLTIKQLYGRYFGMGKGKRTNTLLLILLVALNLLFVISLAALDTAFSSLMGILSLPGLSYSLFFQHSLHFVFAATVYQANRFFTSKIGRSIADRLSKEKNVIDKWIDNIGPDYETIDMVQCSASGRRNTLYKIFSTLNSFLITLTSGLLSLYKLWLLATPVAFVLFSTPFTIPCYILLASLLYPLGYNVLYSYMSHGYQKALDQQKEHSGKLDAHIHLTVRNATKTNMKGSTAKGEKMRFQQLEENEIKPALRYQTLKEILSFIQDLYSEISVAAGIILAAPMLIAKTISIPTTLIISYYFQRIASLFAWTREKNDVIAEIRNGINTLKRCETLHNEPLNISPPNSPHRTTTPVTPLNTSEDYILKVENFSFNPAPEQTSSAVPLFYNHLRSMTLRPGHVVEVVGPSGCGKKTLFKNLFDMANHQDGFVEANYSASAIAQVMPVYPTYDQTAQNTFDTLTQLLNPAERKIITDSCQKIGLHKDIMMQLVSSLAPATQQRLAIIFFLIDYLPSIYLEGSLSVILLNNTFHAIAPIEYHAIITLLQGFHPKAAILHIHYNTRGFPGYTHCLSFEDKDPKTGCRHVAFRPNPSVKQLSCPQHVKLFRTLSPSNHPAVPESTSKKCIIRVENLRFDVSYRQQDSPSTPVQYNRVEALSLHPGDIVEVIGPNGCGKKTFFNILSDLEEFASDGIEWNCSISAITQIAPIYSAYYQTINETLNTLLQHLNPAQCKVIMDGCQNIGLHKDIMRQPMSSLSLSIQQRFAIILFLINTLHSIDSESPRIILMGNLLSELADDERTRIIMYLRSIYPEAAILHIHYAKIGLPCYTHCLFFENQNPNTREREVSLINYGPTERATCRP